MFLYEIVAAKKDGERGLAMARLRRVVFRTLYKAAGSQNLNTIAHKAGLSKRAMRRAFRRDGNITVDQFAAILWACGYEATIELVPAGSPREEVLIRRAEAMKEKE